MNNQYYYLFYALLITTINLHAADHEISPNQRLLTAVAFGNLDTVRSLLEYGGAGANAKKDSHYWQGLLHMASKDGYTEIARELITHGFDINARDLWNETPLHYAAEHGHSKTVEALLELGADPAPKSTYGNTPADLAQRRGHKKVEKYIRNYNDIPTTKGAIMEDMDN